MHGAMGGLGVETVEPEALGTEQSQSMLHLVCILVICQKL